jgi:amino acid adenylation domain-containing protein
VDVHIHKVFDGVAADSPGSIALVSERGSVTYRELNDRAECLASFLQNQGVRVGSYVPLCLDRSIEMIIGMLGVLKAGGAYAPIDPGYPRERLRFMLAELGAPVILTSAEAAAALPETGATVLWLDRDWDRVEGARGQFAEDETERRGEDAACVIFTSGSTGTPKGVIVPHRGIVGLVVNSDYVELGSSDRMAHVSNTGFDAASFEIWGALLNGAQLVIIPEKISCDSRELTAELRRQNVSVLLLTSALFELLASWDGAIFRGIRQVLFGGDVVNAQRVRRVLKSGGAPARLLHVYGPTEDTTFATSYLVTDIPEDAVTVPIGWPISGTTTYVLDDRRNGVPIGTPGELYLGGPRLAIGYLNRPELTRERFVDVSWGEGNNERLYRTGDVVRCLPGGALEFIGRIDRQMKIRGYRVEPAEIENRLNGHRAVASSVVIPRRNRSGQASLVAFFIAEKGQPAPSSAQLSSHLAQTLPAYMIPSLFVRREEWPLSFHGKLDRDALLECLEADREADERTPLSAFEAAVRELCRKVIGAHSMGLDESLIANGLHSLSAANLAWLVEEKFETRITLSEILDTPTVRGLLDLIERRKYGHAAEIPPRITIRGSRPGFIPLSFAQEQVWFLERLHPHLNSYRFQSLLHCDGALNVGALEAALNHMVSRHEILRTVFPAEDQMPRQEIRPYVPFPLSLEDLRALPEDARQRQLDLLIHDELRRPFDTAAGPLIRWRLFQLGDNEFKLLHTEHHFLHDGWSYGIFLGELYATYKAFNEKAALPSQPLPAPFADFALWQREVMASGAWDSQLAFWKEELAGCLHPPSLPSDRRMNIPRTFEGLQIRRPFPQAIWEELGRVCSRAGVTRFSWIHAAFQLFIHRYTGADDFCIGSGFANRRDPCLREMLGMVINTLPIRARFEGVKSFRDLAQRASQALRRASDNQELPFERVVQEINPHREANANPFFNTCIGAYEGVFPHFRSDQLAITTDDTIACGQVKFDLMVLLVPPKRDSVDAAAASPAPLILWEFSTELFEEATAERMLDHFFNLIESSVRDPGAPLSSLSMMDGEERNRVLGFARGSVTPLECETPIHRIFETVAAASPDNCAAVAGDVSLSYQQLNVRANQLANRLAERGCAAGSIVVVALPRGLDAIICLLAILKAGGAYLPIDPREPSDRIARLLGLVNARFILKRSDISRNLPHLPDGTELLLVDDLRAPQEGNPSRDVLPDSPAYVLFTSGSSGVPKAVVIPHRAISRLIFGLPGIVLNRSESILHFAPLNFDASTFEIWGSLLHGAKLVIHCDEFVDLPALGETLERHRVTTAWLTSSLFNQIVDGSPAILRGVRQVITGGEALSPGHIGKAQELLPETRFFNGYGPTETTTFATIYSVPRPFDKAAANVPIGRPIAGTQAVVFSLEAAEGVDRRRELAPIGVPGELYIGGDGVALEYLGFPKLTAERFVFDPEGAFPGRFYRTGDIVRWRLDGKLEFIGRADAQVKIRGYRIEPGEIETILKTHPDVEDAAVVPREDRVGERTLVGYIVPRTDTIITEWKAFLQEKLPSYMIPSAVVRLAAFPLTPRGKIDRLALPKPERQLARGSPRLTPLEETIASVWSDVLEIKDLGPNESFFELGGHSLLVTRVVSQLRTRFGMEIPLRAVFDNPTLAEMGRFLAKYRAGGSDRSELSSDVLREEALL